MIYEEDSELIILTDDESGERLDKVLAQRFSGIHSRTYFQMLIDEQQVLLNGEIVKKRTIPNPGDEIQIHWILSPEIGLTPEPIPLNIIFEDDHILAINKPAGMVVHPAVGNWSGTVVNALLHHCKTLETTFPDSSSLRPGIVHRLDKDTSGILITAKTSSAQQQLVEMFSKRQIYKEYLAICLGNPGNIEISNAIGRHPIHRKLMAVLETGGKPAVTLCKTLGCDGKISLVQIELKTGRTHQIRVHLKHQRTPVLGDNTYGNVSLNTKYGINRQMLHARLLRFIHPVTKKLMELEASLPEDMAKWVNLLKNY